MPGESGMMEVVIIIISYMDYTGINKTMRFPERHFCVILAYNETVTFNHHTTVFRSCIRLSCLKYAYYEVHAVH